MEIAVAPYLLHISMSYSAGRGAATAHAAHNAGEGVSRRGGVHARSCPGCSTAKLGVHVARLAGVPEAVAKRAEILSRPPNAPPRRRHLSAFRRRPAPTEERDEVLAELERLDPDQMSPRAALEALYALRRRLCRTGSAKQVIEPLLSLTKLFPDRKCRLRFQLQQD